MSSEMRAQLGQLETDLLAALVGKAAAPSGFNAQRLEVAADLLTRKRIRAAASAWPTLARALGEQFSERFAAFAAVTPLPVNGGPLADGYAFARALAEAGELPEVVRLDLLTVGLRFRANEDGLIPRRGPAIGAVMLREARRLVLTVRLPGLSQVRSLAIPLKWLAGRPR